MIDACTICDRPVYNALTHPCCVFWARIAPGKPCGGCGASAKYWAEHKTRRKKAG